MKTINFKIYFLLFLSIPLLTNCDRKLNINLFEPDNISTHSVEYSSTFSSSGKELYFARSNQKWGEGKMKSTIYYAEKKDRKWSTPVIASFSGQYNDSGPHLTKDGNTMYFISKRPSADIWIVRKDENGQWEEPSRLPDSINSSHTEYSPRTDGSGNLYFASDRPGGFGQGDLYVSLLKNGKLSSPINLGNAINSPMGEWNLEINEKGDLIIFEASQRKQNVSSYGDLYISFKKDGTWTLPQNIIELNTSGSDLYPFLTKDERQLYYTSSDSLKSKRTNIYFIEFNRLYNKYKKQARLPLR